MVPADTPNRRDFESFRELCEDVARRPAANRALYLKFYIENETTRRLFRSALSVFSVDRHLCLFFLMPDGGWLNKKVSRAALGAETERQVAECIVEGKFPILVHCGSSGGLCAFCQSLRTQNPPVARMIVGYQ